MVIKADVENVNNYLNEKRIQASSTRASGLSGLFLTASEYRYG